MGPLTQGKFSGMGGATLHHIVDFRGERAHDLSKREFEDLAKDIFADSITNYVEGVRQNG